MQNGSLCGSFTLHVHTYFKHARPQIKRSWVKCEGGLSGGVSVWATFGTENSHYLFYCLMMNTCKDWGGGVCAWGGQGQTKGLHLRDREGVGKAGWEHPCMCVSQVTFLQACTCSTCYNTHTLTCTHLNGRATSAKYSIRPWDVEYKQGKYDWHKYETWPHSSNEGKSQVRLIEKLSCLNNMKTVVMLVTWKWLLHAQCQIHKCLVSRKWAGVHRAMTSALSNTLKMTSNTDSEPDLMARLPLTSRTTSVAPFKHLRESAQTTYADTHKQTLD